LFIKMRILSIFIFALLAISALAGPCYDACEKDCRAQGMDNDAVIYHVCTFKCGGKDKLGFSLRSLDERIKNVPQKYRLKAQALVSKYGPTALTMIEKYGPTALAMIEANLVNNNLGGFKSFMKKVGRGIKKGAKVVAPIAKKVAVTAIKSQLGGFKSFMKKVGRGIKKGAKVVAPIAKKAAIIAMLGSFKSFMKKVGRGIKKGAKVVAPIAKKVAVTAIKSQLGASFAELAKKYGPKAAAFIVKLGPKAMELINKYGLNALTFIEQQLKK
jgi:hypothetical protein